MSGLNSENTQNSKAGITVEAAVNDFLNRHQIDDADMRHLISTTSQALKLIEVKLAQAGLDAHARGNFWHLLTLLRSREPVRQ